MRSTIRCCISCILPCGSLDVIRIVHVDGRVEEIDGGTVIAAEIMKAYPKHILKKPTSRFPDDVPGAADSGAPRILVVPPDAQLKRGKIYFLIPVSKPARTSGDSGRRRKKETPAPAPVTTTRTDETERYLSELLREKVTQQRDHRRGRVGVWRPRLESISESAFVSAGAGDDQ